MNTILLNEPITAGGSVISELILRRPKVRVYLAIDRLDGSDLAREVALTANLALADFQLMLAALADYYRSNYCESDWDPSAKVAYVCVCVCFGKLS